MLTANMVLFAFLDAFFLRPLPIAGAERHMELSAVNERGWVQRQWPLLAARVPFLEAFPAGAYVLVPLALVGCALLASLVPALRAAAIDPLAAIRED